MLFKSNSTFLPFSHSSFPFSLSLSCLSRTKSSHQLLLPLIKSPLFVSLSPAGCHSSRRWRHVTATPPNSVQPKCEALNRTHLSWCATFPSHSLIPCCCCCCCFGVTSSIHPTIRTSRAAANQRHAAWALAKWAIYLAGEPQARHNNSRNNNSNNRISYTRHSIRADANNAVREIKRFICRNTTQSKNNNNNNYTTFGRISFSVFLASLSQDASIEQQQQQQQHEVNETPWTRRKEKKKNEAKSKIAIFDGLFSCLLHLLLGGAAIMYWRWNNLNSHRSHRSSQHTPCLSPSPSPSASSPKQMKGSRLKVQTDIIYRSNHLVAATTTSDPKSIKKETGQVLPSSRDLKLTLNQPPSSIPLLLLCLLSCNKWKTSSSTTTGTTLHIIFVGAVAAAAIGF